MDDGTGCCNVEQWFDRTSIEDAADCIRAVPGGSTAAHDIDMVDGVGIEGEEVLVGALAIEARVHADAIEEHDRLLSGSSSDKR